MKIIIPTYRRLGRQLTLAALAPDLHPDVTLIVRPDEFQRTHSAVTCAVRAMPPEVDDLWKTRQWIWENYSNERFVMCDDDIRSFETRLEDGSSRKSTPEEQRRMLADLEEQLDLGAGIAAPRSHWAPPGKGEVTHAADAVQFVTLDGPRLRPLGIRWDRCKVEDRDVVMQVLSHGIDVVALRRWSFSAMMSGQGDGGINAGGDLSWGDRAKLAREWMGDLARLWPEHVTPSANSPTGFRMHRSRLLQESRRKLMETEGNYVTCQACQMRVEERLCDGACQRCRDVLELVRGDRDVLRGLTRYLSGQDGTGASTPTPGARRGRPALGDNHPVLLRMRGKGSFRAEDVSDLYASRNSASVSLCNLTKAGKLARVGLGLFEVRVEEPVDMGGGGLT